MSLFHLGPIKQFVVILILFLQIVGETSKDFRRQEFDQMVVVSYITIITGHGAHLGNSVAKFGHFSD
jgi:hypothetical protein